MKDYLLLAGSFGLFALLHSLLAGGRFSRSLSMLLGDRFVSGWYRLAYNLFAALTILPVIYLAVSIDSPVIYRLNTPWLIISCMLMGIGLVGLVGALFVTDVWHFAGVRQVAAYLRGGDLPVPPPALQKTGMYRITRHPLYLFLLLVIWPLPVMSVTILVINLLITMYLLVGSRLEENRLKQLYGSSYETYQSRVAWLIPWPARMLREGSAISTKTDCPTRIFKDEG
nr:isoprenylcysteine carboxylmethyltransferase family protein [Anaerolineae bacterium]